MNAVSALLALVVVSCYVQVHQCAGYGSYGGSSGNTTSSPGKDDAPFKAIVQAIGKAEVALQAFAKQNANADVQDPLTGFFVAIILTTDAVISKMFAVGSGTGGNITGTQCLTLIRKAVFVTQQAALHASDPVKGTGANGAMTVDDQGQQLLQNLGKGLNDLAAAATANQNAQNPGKYLNVILTLNSNIGGLNSVVGNADTSPACLDTMKKTGASQLQILNSVNE